MIQKFWPLIVLVLVAVVTLVTLIHGPEQPKEQPRVEDLEIEDIVVGDGNEAKKGDTVEVHYVGTLRKNGKQFDSSEGKPPFRFTIGTGGVIKGWDLGVVGMKEGGRRKLVIPARLAYGSQSPSPDIPPNSDLVFEVQLIRIIK